MTVGGKLNVLRVVAVLTGAEGVPADGGAGRGLRVVVDVGVAVGGNFNVLGVIAVLTGAVSLPAYLGAGRSLRVVVDVGVAVGGNLNILGIVTVLAGAVGVPADLGAGRGLRIVVDKRVMGSIGNNNIPGFCGIFHIVESDFCSIFDDLIFRAGCCGDINGLRRVVCHGNRFAADGAGEDRIGTGVIVCPSPCRIAVGMPFAQVFRKQ